MAISSIGRIRLNVFGARGAVGIDLDTPATAGQYLVKAAGSDTRKYVGSTPAGSIADAVKATDLAGPTGSQRVGVGGISLDDKLKEIASVKDTRFAGGAKGNSTTNDSTAIQTAINSNSGIIRVPLGNYITSSSMDILNGTSLTGYGAGFSAINPKNSNVNNNTITLVGTPSSELISIDGLFIGDPSNGGRVGRDGILLLTNATGKYFAKPVICNNSIGSGSGVGIRHIHSSGEVQGGMYGALIENNLVRGGIVLDQSGDSNNVLNNILAGSFIGVDAFLIEGASLLQVQGNNITNSGGSIRIRGGSRFRILGNNCENLSPGASAQNNGAVFYFNGINETLVGGVIKENLISAFGSTDATKLLYLQNCRGTLIEDNVFGVGVAGVTTDIEIGNTCRSVRIGANSYNRANGDIPAPIIIDNGVGTIGIVKTVVGQNGWVENGVGQGIRYIKTNDGIVQGGGRFKSGNTMDGTVAGNMPEGFRPSGVEWIPCTYSTPDGYANGLVAIDADGNITIYGAQRLNSGTPIPSSQASSFTVRFNYPANGLANALAPQ